MKNKVTLEVLRVKNLVVPISENEELQIKGGFYSNKSSRRTASSKKWQVTVIDMRDQYENLGKKKG